MLFCSGLGCHFELSFRIAISRPVTSRTLQYSTYRGKGVWQLILVPTNLKRRCTATNNGHFPETGSSVFFPSFYSSFCSVVKSCPTLCDPMDCSPPGSSVHGIFQARVLEWVAISSSRGSSRPRDWTHVSCTVGGSFTAKPPVFSLLEYWFPKLRPDLVANSHSGLFQALYLMLWN